MIIFKLLSKLLTRNRKHVGLLYVDLNYKRYKETGDKKDTIICKAHPIFTNDEFLEDKFYEIAEYIKQNYDYKDII